jgi:hypothetical protein
MGTLSARTARIRKARSSPSFSTGVGQTVGRMRFLQNHGEVIVAFDFFTVPTVSEPNPTKDARSR